MTVSTTFLARIGQETCINKLRAELEVVQRIMHDGTASTSEKIFEAYLIQSRISQLQQNKTE